MIQKPFQKFSTRLVVLPYRLRRVGAVASRGQRSDGARALERFFIGIGNRRKLSLPLDHLERLQRRLRIIPRVDEPAQERGYLFFVPALRFEIAGECPGGVRRVPRGSQRRDSSLASRPREVRR